MTLFILGLLASLLIGLSLGYLGSGGSIITVPVLIYLFRVPVHDAIGMSLVIVGSTSLVGAYLNHRQGSHLDVRSGVLFGLTGLGGAYLGSLTSSLVTDQVLMLLFALLMTVVATLMLVRPEVEPSPNPVPQWKTILVGVGVGFLTGFLGVGGGFLIVPALVLFVRLNIRTAVGTSLLVITMNCAAGFAGHLHSTSLNLTQTFTVAALSMCGLLAGTWLSRGSSPAQLHRYFAGFVLVTGVTLFALNV